MALPLLAPLAWLLPLIKILALGSVKFIGVGLGAAIAPVTTANFLVNMSSGTPLKYAKFRNKTGYFTDEQIVLIENAHQIVLDSIENKEERLTRKEAREFLKEVLVSTVVGMKQPIVSAPGAFVRLCKQCLAFVWKPFSSGDK